MTNVLFVCTGNTCRSPLAEAIFNSKNKDRSIQVKSAGIFAADGAPMSGGSERALAKRDITVEHRAQSVTADLLKWADLVLTMTDSHRSALIDMYPHAAEKIFPLKKYANTDREVTEKLEKLKEEQAEIPSFDIIDPFGGDDAIYEETYKEIEEEIDKLLEKINNNKA